MATDMAKTTTVEPQWYVVDAADKTLGRLASRIAHHLRGKHKPSYTPHVDTGDYIVVIHADKIKVTKEKAQTKYYHRYSGYPSGLKTASFAEMQTKHPGRLLKIAVKGMLPKGPLGYRMLTKLKIYAGAIHPHQAQQPQSIDLL
ncbi:MAG: 50S ribosomal protein L13 [Coxiella sp. RIFCSPHIGHO2_12_FULL_44_14]|nr:MAG: 50S ribosomal protein L13 [Coxiella sp. RIFCSPHIGHO2_12_FULL_44_14]